MYLIKQNTIAMIKSSGLARNLVPEIEYRIVMNDMRIIASAHVHLAPDEVATFYAESVGKDYYERLTRSVTGEEGVLFLVLSGVDAVTKWRDLMGATDPRKAAPGTIRHDFGTVLPDNIVHGSDSEASAAREYQIVRNFLRSRAYGPDVKEQAPAVARVALILPGL